MIPLPAGGDARALSECRSWLDETQAYVVSVQARLAELSTCSAAEWAAFLGQNTEALTSFVEGVEAARCSAAPAAPLAPIRRQVAVRPARPYKGHYAGKPCV